VGMETTSTAVTPTGCCPPFDPLPWNDNEVVWQDKLFVREHVHCLMHVPVDMTHKMRHAGELIEAARARAEVPLTVSDEISPWRSDLYIAVDKPVPGADMETLSGTFMTRVFDGPFRDAPKWAEEMKRHVAARGRHLDKIYFGYTTCPRCAKAYGHNYVVLMARVEPRWATVTDEIKQQG
jgi:hypothetical protein